MDSVYNYFKKLVSISMMGLLAVIIYFSFFTINDAAGYLKKVVEYPQYLLVLASVLVIATIYVVFLYIEACQKKYLKLMVALCAVLLLAGQALVIFSLDITQITDAFIVQDQARAIALGVNKHIDYESIQYFSRYGNNNFLVLLFVWGYKVLDMLHCSNITLPFAVFNAFFIDLGVLLLYKTVSLFKGKKMAAKVLVLCVLSPINYLSVWWLYSCTLSIPVGVALVYLSALIFKKDYVVWKKCCLGAGVGFLIVIGYLLRPTTLIPFIAVICCFFMYKKRGKQENKRYFVIGICLLITAIGSYMVLDKQISRYAVESEDNFPATHWVMMGIHGDGKVTEEDNLFTESFVTKSEKVEANIKEIKSTIKEYGISGFVNHYIEKLPITWSDGTNEYMTRLRQIGTYSRIYQWIAGEKADFLILYCQSYYIALLVLVFVSIYHQWKMQKYNYMFLFTLTLFGGVLFYLIWEAKASYSLPFLSFIFVLAADGACIWGRKKSGLQRRTIIRIGAVLVSATIIIGVANYWNFSKMTNNWKQYVIYTSNMEEVIMDWDETVSEEGKVLTQEFYAEKEFNTLRIACKEVVDAESEYKVQLCSDGKVIKEFVAKKDNIKNSFLTFNFKLQVPKGKQKYQIKIMPMTPGETDSIQWGAHYSKVSDQYEGDYYSGDEKQSTDLFIRVYWEKDAVYMSPKLYAFFMFGILLWEIGLVCVFLLKDERNKK